MSAAGGVGDTHRGAEGDVLAAGVRRRPAERLPALRRARLRLLQQRLRLGPATSTASCCSRSGGRTQADRAFRRGCDNGFRTRLCANLDEVGPGRSPRARRPRWPTTRSCVRDGRRLLPPGLSPLEIYQRACEQGFADGCRHACELGDLPACDGRGDGRTGVARALTRAARGDGVPASGRRGFGAQPLQVREMASYGPGSWHEEGDDEHLSRSPQAAHGAARRPRSVGEGAPRVGRRGVWGAAPSR